jgi:hypothetical protein
MSREVGWSIRQLVAGKYREVSGTDLQTDLLSLMDDLEKHGESCQENHLLSPLGMEFIAILLPAIRQFKKAIKKF